MSTSQVDVATAIHVIGVAAASKRFPSFFHEDATVPWHRVVAQLASGNSVFDCFQGLAIGLVSIGIARTAQATNQRGHTQSLDLLGDHSNFGEPSSLLVA